MASLTAFLGTVPANYDTYLGPLLFELYAIDLAARLHEKEVSKVLELACGTGRVTRHLAAILKGMGTLTATDLNADMLTVAKEKVPDPDIAWQVADAQALPFDANSFTAIVCQFGVMFFPDKEMAFKEAYRVLQPGGLLLFNTWDSLQMNPVNMLIQQVLRDVLSGQAPEFLEKGPFSFYDEKVIQQLLEEAGFKQVRIEKVPKMGRTASVMNVVDGFTKGSPLAAYLQEQDTSVREEIVQRLANAISNQYGDSDLHIPMQALVCSARK